MKHPKLVKLMATLGMIALVIVLIALGLKFIFPDLWEALKSGDEKGLELFLKQAKGWKMLAFLAAIQFIQIISIVLPSPPIHIAGGMVAGTLRAFVTCHIAYCIANMVVFVAARKFHGRLNKIDESGQENKLTEWLSQGDPWIVVILACMVPIVPNGLIPYAAAQTPMKKSAFLGSVFVGGFVPTLLLCAIGSNIMQADYPFILLLISIDIICMYQVYNHKDDAARVMAKIAAMQQARKGIKKEQREAKREAAKAIKDAARTLAQEAKEAGQELIRDEEDNQPEAEEEKAAV